MHRLEEVGVRLEPRTNQRLLRQLRQAPDADSLSVRAQDQVRIVTNQGLAAAPRGIRVKHRSRNSRRRQGRARDEQRLKRAVLLDRQRHPTNAAAALVDLHVPARGHVHLRLARHDAVDQASGRFLGGGDRRSATVGPARHHHRRVGRPKVPPGRRPPVQVQPLSVKDMEGVADRQHDVPAPGRHRVLLAVGHLVRDPKRLRRRERLPLAFGHRSPERRQVTNLVGVAGRTVETHHRVRAQVVESRAHALVGVGDRAPPSQAEGTGRDDRAVVVGQAGRRPRDQARPRTVKRARHLHHQRHVDLPRAVVGQRDVLHSRHLAVGDRLAVLVNIRPE